MVDAPIRCRMMRAAAGLRLSNAVAAVLALLAFAAVFACAPPRAAAASAGMRIVPQLALTDLQPTKVAFAPR